MMGEDGERRKRRSRGDALRRPSERIDDLPSGRYCFIDMRMPKMSSWVILGGIAIWIATAGVAMTYNLMSFYDSMSLPNKERASSLETRVCEGWWENYWCSEDKWRELLTRDIGNRLLGYFFLPITVVFLVIQDYSRLSVESASSSIFPIIVLTPWIAIPLYWFVLHQIDKAIKRKRGTGTA
jgi:hypothetical protein